MTKEADAAERAFAGLRGDDYPDWPREWPVAPPSYPRVGDLIAVRSRMGNYFEGPFPIAVVEDDRVEIELEPAHPDKIEYDRVTKAGLIVPLKYLTLTEFLNIETGQTWKAWAGPAGPKYLVLSGGYGTGPNQWLYAGDPAVNFATADDLHEEELKVQMIASRNQMVAFATTGKSTGLEAPACRICNQWPCKKTGDCPDYPALWTKGLRWIPGEKRLETYREAARRLTCGRAQ